MGPRIDDTPSPTMSGPGVALTTPDLIQTRGRGSDMSDATRVGGTTTDLYRYYDRFSRLLYVGISLSAVQRAGQHRADKGWWSDVVRMEVERYPTRELAIAAEREAIVSEKPMHNVVHNSGATPMSAVQAWQCRGKCLRRIAAGRERGYVQIDGWGIWQCVCRDCDDVPGSLYWIDSARITTTDDIARWTAHLLGKRWFTPVEWLDMVTDACLIPGARRAAQQILHDRWPNSFSFLP